MFLLFYQITALFFSIVSSGNVVRQFEKMIFYLLLKNGNPLWYCFQQENGLAEHVDKKTATELPDKLVRAAINLISKHQIRKTAPNNRNPEHQIRVSSKLLENQSSR